MRNRSESTPVRPANRMTDSEIYSVVLGLTAQTEVRIWFGDLEEFIDENADEWDECDALFREGEELTDAEDEAVRNGTPLNCVVSSIATEYDEAVVMLEVGALYDTYNIEIDRHALNGIYHIEVTQAGLPPAETIEFSNGYITFRLDPAAEHIRLDGRDADVEEGEELYRALGRWLRHKGVDLSDGPA